MNGSPFGGAHQDVLGQTPTDPDSKARLVEEIRSRAKMAFARKDMPVCDALYSKALEVLPDAPLYSNRSAVRLTLGKFEEARADAQEATKLDKTYAKGFYRLGQASEKCHKYKEAAKAYNAGAALEPDSKVWPAALVKCEKAKVAYDAAPKKKVEKAEALYSDDEFRKQIEKRMNPDGTIKSTNLGDTSMRGYKVDSQGRKTTFFNNELDEKTKALIGDIAPKKVEAAVDMKVGAGESSWNQAGTFESKDHTKWAKAWLEAKFGNGFMVDLPDRSIGATKVPCFLTVTKFHDFKGDASTAQARGKKKWVLDAAFKLDWEFPVDSKGAVAKGTATFPDVSCDAVDFDEPLEYSLDVDPISPRESAALIASHVQHADKGLRPAVL
eukprot:CAMPEP_0119289048 /NCGR_PEP_ID=MMETSP1329-20130426/38318_1 /TAXON_ID=114041 /ORGANISM="Genus nov. species nov., Strain RCC1024" /LENGTH=382 /DNA_ID=CAMNT_0007289833 /DNA_START=114 /DNA_END=1258 /DNA_ORIENTATION=-